MNEILDNAKCFATVFGGLLLAVGVGVAALSLLLNLLKLILL
jgi:hypothetical protein